ncbi:MAG: hypothetical protein HWN66_18520 [Candidatus Helarchaeota archaeon]|nr:hypothetical protein [Candidatus Helarchaeota archaeon]
MGLVWVGLVLSQNCYLIATYCQAGPQTAERTQLAGIRLSRHSAAQ